MKLLITALKTIQQNRIEDKFVANLMKEIQDAEGEKRKYSDITSDFSLEEVKIHTDASVKRNCSGCGCVIYLDDKIIKYCKPLQPNLYVDEAEFEAVLFAVNKLKALGVRNCRVTFCGDGITYLQLAGQAKIRKIQLKEYALDIFETLNQMRCIPTFMHIPRVRNAEADRMASLAVSGIVVDGLTTYR